MNGDDMCIHVLLWSVMCCYMERGGCPKFTLIIPDVVWHTGMFSQNMCNGARIISNYSKVCWRGGLWQGPSFNMVLKPIFIEVLLWWPHQIRSTYAQSSRYVCECVCVKTVITYGILLTMQGSAEQWWSHHSTKTLHQLLWYDEGTPLSRTCIIWTVEQAVTILWVTFSKLLSDSVFVCMKAT